ncbi:MAG: NAD(P)-binding domain-containing protein [Solirubrobacterales bacterium]|nr:NAD(P)-binding domain-containing protein [Solirubrobacterales bacterium]
MAPEGGPDHELPWALIGAGPTGLSAARNLSRRGIPFVGFEVHSDVGGLWNIESPKSTMYESAHLISSKTTTAFDEFPMRDEVADFPSHWEMNTYFQDYADTFDLRRNYRFETEVIAAEPTGEGDDSTWKVTVRGPEGEETGEYAGVIIANGILSEPSIPEFEGQDEFEGEIVHTAGYKRPDVFRDKRILIVGAGNSGCDIAVDAVHYAKSIEMSMRSGYWFFPKYIFGRPSDTLNEGKALPAFLKTRIDGKFIRFLTGNPARLGFPEPEGRIYETHPVMNTQVLYYAGHGDIKIRKNIRRFTRTGVEFVDGSSGEYDMVMLATGYKLHYPFIDPEHLNWRAGSPDLYLNIFTPRHRNVFVLGMVEATGLGWQGRYNQADLVAGFIEAGERDPARAEEMWRRVGGPKPDLFAGYNYRQLDRLPFYVNKDAYRAQIHEHLKIFG